MALDLIRAQILALFFTGIFLGFHLILSVMTLWAQIWANPARGRKTNWILVAISLVIGTIGILNAALDVYVNMWALTTENLEKVDEIVPSIIGDTVLTYRCWIVYERRWKAVIISIILWISAVTFAVFVVVKSALVQYVTRHIRSQWQAVGQTKLTYVNRIIIESGLIYTISAIIFLFTAIVQSNAIYITGDCASWRRPDMESHIRRRDPPVLKFTKFRARSMHAPQSFETLESTAAGSVQWRASVVPPGHWPLRVLDT
ncbi:hypothetical protein CERSUDRAFT_73577 [Gelatoporia subvermispora B]|uniref:Uncharacterized protein n=1 Tax=Ceriporiopsis subvermispora (strain B) TaxID=914234 RepID=M2QL41_CERS8|nr:hypothetical protein CERSUDRAFT_73577 [Gelatoporia subvermispora B]